MAPPRDRRPGFSRRAQYGLFFGYVLLVAGLVVGPVLLVLSSFNPPAFAALRSAVAEVTTPVSSGGAAIGRGLAAIPDGIGAWIGVHGENRRLKARLASEDIFIQRARALAFENNRLRRLLQVRDGGGGAVVTARLVSSSASSGRRFAVLNAGRLQGVRPEMAVEGAEGLIGRIVETGPNTARVLLLSDPESVVPVRRARDGMAAFAAGRGDGLVDIRAVNLADAVMRPGDLFVSTGTGGIYPPNVPVARVARGGRDTALAQPVANPDLLDFAVVRPLLVPIPPSGAPLR